MPYISKLERERQRARQEEQTEEARWMQFKDAVTYVQEKEGCTAESAAEQLITDHRSSTYHSMGRPDRRTNYPERLRRDGGGLLGWCWLRQEEL